MLWLDGASISDAVLFCTYHLTYSSEGMNMLRKILMRAISYIFVLIGPAKAGACFSFKDLLHKSLSL